MKLTLVEPKLMHNGPTAIWITPSTCSPGVKYITLNMGTVAYCTCNVFQKYESCWHINHVKKQKP